MEGTSSSSATPRGTSTDDSNQSGNIPMQFIRHQGGKLELVEETAKYLSSFNCPVTVIGIAGVVGSGKSYLMNRLSKGAQDGFQPGTKGIWVRSLPCKGKQGEDYITLLLDTEGLGNRQDNNFDASLFALSVILSSYFIYNSSGEIDERAILQLHFLLSLPNCISSSDDFKKQPPPFLWVLRDNHNQVDKDYLERQLAIREGIEINSQTCNFITRRFTGYFRERDCISLPPPGEMDDANSLFSGKMEELVSLIQQKAPPKTLLRSDASGTRKLYKLTGTNFVIYAREFITRLNNSVVLKKKDKENNTPRKEPSSSHTLRTAKKETSSIKKSIDSVDMQLQINSSKFEQELQENEKQKAPLHNGEYVTVAISGAKIAKNEKSEKFESSKIEKSETKTQCRGFCGGAVLTCVGYARYALGALVVFALVIGLIIYFTKK